MRRNIPIALMFVTFLTSQLYSQQTISCHVARGSRDRRLCLAVAPNGYQDDWVTWEAFKITAARIDLNNDGRSEYVVWESSWAGSSGGGLWILEAKGNGFRKLFEGDTAWSPILLLDSNKTKWRKVAYLQAGGGLDELFYILRYNGGRYRAVESQATPPKGRVLIGKDWKRSVFGPMK